MPQRARVVALLDPCRLYIQYSLYVHDDNQLLIRVQERIVDASVIVTMDVTDSYHSSFII